MAISRLPHPATGILRHPFRFRMEEERAAVRAVLHFGAKEDTTDDNATGPRFFFGAGGETELIKTAMSRDFGGQ